MSVAKMCVKVKENHERGRRVEEEDHKAKRGIAEGGCTHHAWSLSYDDRSSHPYNAGTEHVRFSPMRQTFLASSAKRY